MNAPIVAAEEEISRYPNLDLAQVLHKYDYARLHGQPTDQLKQKIMVFIEEDSMAPFYEHLVEKYVWELDENLLNAMKDKNVAELNLLESKREDILKNAGDLELIELDSKKGKYFARIGDWNKASTIFDEIIAKPKAGSGRKIDAYFDKGKILLFRNDVKGLKGLLADISKIIELGGDWDRRNKLKVYEAFYSIMIRDISKAASLFQDGIATFSSTDICTYNEFMFYAVLTNVLVLPRNDLKKKIIDNAHVISVIIDMPILQELIDSLYACNYEKMMKTLLSVEADVVQDRYLGPHSVHLLREFRILAFSQFLEAYKSVLLSSMAKSFGISTDLLDRELSKLIASGRLNAKIDKVGDVVETLKSDKRNAQYQDVVKKGDLLLNQIQKLVRFINQ